MEKIIVANWKMNPATEKKALKLAQQEDFKNAVIVPPFPFLAVVNSVLKQAALGAQDVFWQKSGPFTGEVSARQLKSVGVQYVIIGHSERRALGETDVLINKKVKTALEAGLKVILCVGETKRKLGMKNDELRKAKNYVKQQLLKGLKGVSNLKSKIHHSLIIAYEPVWAIGTGRADHPAETGEMARFIKSFIYSKLKIKNLKFLYGGSINSKNVQQFLNQKEIDGLLVGGTSLKSKEFKKLFYEAND